MTDAELQQSILDLVGRPSYQPVKPRLIAQRLGVPKNEAKEVKQAIKQLVRQGRLAYGTNHLVRPADPTRATTNRMIGVFQRTQKGFGFVRPTGDVAAAAAPDGQRQDIFIPAKRTGNAATGDTVLVLLKKSRRPDRPGPVGEILEIIERQTHQFVGTYLESGGNAYVQVDGTLFAQPIWVGDPGAKGAQLDDKVVIEMVRFPTPMHEGEGVITEVLGPRGRPGVDTLSIIRQFNLPEEFAEDALDEARVEAENFEEAVPEGRRDLTKEVVVTIDPADARDFDDAISLRRLDNGHWLLGVHIADVAHFVRPRTALDREARDRATSIYLPDQVIPMLPEVISNSLASLQPKRVRLVKSAMLEFTPEGQRVHTELHSAAIQSNRRLSYEQVDQFLADPEPWRRKLGAEVHDLLGRMHTLAMILRKRRMTRGALELNLPEVKVELDGDGQVAGARVVKHTESHQIIEEFMLAANEAVAEALAEKELPFLRRVHPAPAPHKLKALTEFVRELGLTATNLQSRFEMQQLLDQAADRPEQYAVNYALLRSLERAVYSPAAEGHYALASDCYCHFTSPIRRYPDLTIHRMIDAILLGKRPPNVYDEMVVLGQHCSDREQRAEAAERDLTKLKLLLYLSTRLGEEMDMVVTGVESFGLFVQGIDLPAEGLIHTDALVDDYYRYDRAAHTLSGHRSGNVFRLGDRLRAAVARVDMERREVDFRLIRHDVAEPGTERPKSEEGPPAKAKNARSTKVKRTKKRRK